MPVSPESQTVPLKQRLRLRLPPLSLPTLTLDFILPLQLHKGGRRRKNRREEEKPQERVNCFPSMFQLSPWTSYFPQDDTREGSGRQRRGRETTDESELFPFSFATLTLDFILSSGRYKRGKRNTEEKKWKTSKTLYFPQDDTEQKSKEDKPHGESATASLPSSKPLPRRFLSMMQRKKEELNTHRRI